MTMIAATGSPEQAAPRGKCVLDLATGLEFAADAMTPLQRAAIEVADEMRLQADNCGPVTGYNLRNAAEHLAGIALVEIRAARASQASPSAGAQAPPATQADDYRLFAERCRILREIAGPEAGTVTFLDWFLLLPERLGRQAFAAIRAFEAGEGAP